MLGFFRGGIVVAILACANAQSGLTRFDKWVSDFQMVFSNNEHRERVYKTWVENDKYIEQVNAQNLTYTLGHNQYSGMNSEEFSEHMRFTSIVDKINNIKDRIEHAKEKIDKARVIIEETKCVIDCVKQEDYTKLKKVECMTSCLDEDLGSSVPAEIDWVKKGAVTGVKNQGQCGSCWSFSTTGAMEGAYYLKYGTLDSFSEQELVDCDTRSNGGKDMGCNGGLMDNAFSWIKKNGGICTEKDYPYVSGETKKAGTCHSCDAVKGTEVEKYVDVPSKSDDDMMEAVAQQPVSVAIQADQKDFQLYKSGVFTGSCGTKLDHGVLVVGYGEMDGEQYYKLKNSWGTSWGKDGYIYIGRGPQYNRGQGQCGVLLSASYPVL